MSTKREKSVNVPMIDFFFLLEEEYKEIKKKQKRKILNRIAVGEMPN